MLCPNPSICYFAGCIKCDRAAELLRSESIACYSHPQINMTFTGDPDSAPALPTAAEAAVAKTSSRALESHLQNHPSGESLKLILNEKEGKTIDIPAAALPLLLAILQQTSSGNTVKLTPITKQLHIYQAADILGVSDKYMRELLDAGKIPYKTVRNSRRIRYEDLMDYKKQSYEESSKIMDMLVDESEALGLYH